jgi:uncharacterized Zn-finger protein
MTNHFVENVNLRAVQWLNTQLSSEMVALYADPEELGSFTFIKKIIQSFVKGRGSIKVNYKRSQYDTDGCFRLYSSGGLQNIPSKFRGLLCQGLSTDVDMVNCHPTIAMNLCQKHEIECPYLTKYCTDRETILSDGKITKTDFLKLMNKESFTKGLTSWGMAVDNEIKYVQRELAKHYPRILQLADEKSKKNKMGTFMSYLCQMYETQILESIIENCPYKISVLMFDGFLVDGNVPDDYCDTLHEFVKEKFNMDIKFSIKPHDTTLVIPDDYHFEDSEIQYSTLKIKYESQKLAYIERSSSYSIIIGNRLEFKTAEEMKRHFEREMVGEECFFDKWKKDPTAQVYQDVGMYCHDVKCPDNVLNLWTGFAASKLTPHEVDIEPFLNHVRIMANHDESVYQFLIKWMANMFQFPSTPSIFVALSSDEGTGKSALMQLITNMVGCDKSIEIDNPETQLFGTFNAHLQDKVFININEVDRKDMNQFYNKLKSAINSPTCCVHDKGKKAFDITNIRHYFCTTNNDHAVIVKEGNRRYMMAQTSNELIGKHEYHTGFYNWIDKPSTQYSVYNYLMNLPNIPKKFIVSDIPITNLMRDAYELNKDPMEDFVQSFTNGIDGDDLYIEYKDYMRRHGYDGSITSKAFLMKFAKFKDKYKIDVKRIDKVEDGNRVSKRIYSRQCLIE